MAARANLRDTTKAKYATFLNVHLVPELGGLALPDVNLAVVDGFRDRKLAAGLAPATVTVNGLLILRGAALDVAEERA